MTAITDSNDVTQPAKDTPSLEAALNKEGNKSAQSHVDGPTGGATIKTAQSAPESMAKDPSSDRHQPLTSIPTPTSISSSISRRLSSETDNGNLNLIREISSEKSHPRNLIREISAQGQEIGRLKHVTLQLSDALREKEDEIKALCNQLALLRKTSEEYQTTIASQKSACDILVKHSAHHNRALKAVQQELAVAKNKSGSNQRSPDQAPLKADRLKTEGHKRIRAERELEAAIGRTKDLEDELRANNADCAEAQLRLESLQDFLPKLQALIQTELDTVKREWQAQASTVQAPTSKVRSEDGDGLGLKGSETRSDVIAVLNRGVSTPSTSPYSNRRQLPLPDSACLLKFDRRSQVNSERLASTAQVSQSESGSKPGRRNVAVRRKVGTTSGRGFITTPLYTNPHDDFIELFERCNVEVGPVYQFPYINAAAYAKGDESVQQMLDEIDAIVRSGGDITADNIRRAHYEVTTHKRPENMAHKIARINQGTALLAELCGNRPERRDLLEAAAEMNRRKRQFRNQWDPCDETEKLTYALIERDQAAAGKRKHAEVESEGEWGTPPVVGKTRRRPPRRVPSDAFAQ